MSSRQLYDLTPEELADHAHEIYQAARRPARATAAGVLPEGEVATAAAWAKVEAAQAAVWAALTARGEADAEDDEDLDMLTNAEFVALPRAEAIAYLDILHRQQMIGEWPERINEAVIKEQIHQATPSVIVEKQEVKKHMGSMLGDWDKAGKLSKRRIRKTKTKTKRRRQKITKRRRK
jgi:hypothetical protein